MSDDSMWAKQLASTVRQGRKITVSILDEEQQEGYLAGMDAQSIFLLVPTLTGSHQKLLIPRTAILFVHIQDERTFMEESDYDEMSKVARPFKDYINKTYFAQEHSESSTTAATRRRPNSYR
jgi:hypothetical protein